MELKEAIQKIKIILNGEEATEQVETTETVEAPAEEVKEEVKEEVIEAPAIDVEALLAEQKAQFDAQIESLKNEFREELTKVRAEAKSEQSQIVAILEKVSEIPTEEPSEKPRNVFADHAETKQDKVAKAAEMMKQFRENNKK